VGAVIFGTREIVLDWESHELADRYEIWLVDQQEPDRPAILDFEEVSHSRYELVNGLRPSRYVWAVFAYDEHGHMIAESEIAKFEVESVEGEEDESDG
jgi:hypothetical protein